MHGGIQTETSTALFGTYGSFGKDCFIWRANELAGELTADNRIGTCDKIAAVKFI